MEPPEKRVKLVEQAPAPALAPADGGNGNDSGAGVNPYLTDYVTPATPPFAPTDTSTKAGMIAEERAKHGLKAPARSYGPADTKLWTKRQAEIFRNKKATAPGTGKEGQFAASAYMRWWFAEHAGQPCGPKNAPRSAYAIFSQKRLSVLGCGAGDKKQLRKIGAEWKAMDDAAQQPFVAELEHGKQQWEDAEEAFQAQLSQWRKEKRARLIEEDAVISNSARTAAKLAPICNCATCEGDDHDEPVADP